MGVTTVVINSGSAHPHGKGCVVHHLTLAQIRQIAWHLKNKKKYSYSCKFIRCCQL